MNDECTSKYKQFMRCSYFAFFTVVILLSILLWEFPVVHAETVTVGGATFDNDSSNMESLVQHYELFVPSGTVLMNNEDSGFPFDVPNIDSDGMATSPYSFLPNGLWNKSFVETNFPSSRFQHNSNTFVVPKVFTFDGSQYNISDYSYCLVLGYDYQSSIYYRFVLGTNPRYLMYWAGGAGLSGNFKCFGSTDFICLDFTANGDFTWTAKPYYADGNTWVSQHYYRPLLANGPIYSNYVLREERNHGYFTYLAMKDFSTDYDNPQMRETININYLVNDSSEYDDGSGGDISNNMYMRTADWLFNVPEYATSHQGNLTTYDPKVQNWGLGNIIFTGLLNDFQRDHDSDYRLKFDFYIKFKTHRTSTTNGDIDENINKSFAYRDCYVDLHDFIHSNNIQSCSVEDLFSHAKDINNQSMLSYMNWFKNEYNNQSQFDNTVWSIDCSAHLVSGNYTSGALQEEYSFITQISKEKSNTITDNTNPYVDDEGNNKDDNSSDDDTSSVNYKDGQIILTNNDNDSNHQVVNIDNGHDEIIEVLVDKMVPDNANSNGGLTHSFMDMTNSNQWFSVMAAAMPYVPQTFWNAMFSMLTICVGIIGIAFVFWIICHIL